MRVWLIQVGEPLPTDRFDERPLRTGILAKFLLERGHEVVWWGSTFDHSRKKYRCSGNAMLKVSERFSIRLLHSVGYVHNVSFRRLLYNWDVGRRFSRLAGSEPRPDVIVSSLPTIELSAAAVAFGRQRGIPVVIDIRDLWPDIFLDVIPSSLRWGARLLLWPFFRAVGHTLRRADGIIATSFNYLDWGLHYATRQRRENDAVFYIGYERANIPEVDLVKAHKVLIHKGVNPKKTICCFIGSFGLTCDLGTVIEAAHRLEERGLTDVQFVFCGDGERMSVWWRQAVGISSVIFLGWVSRSVTAALMKISSVGLVSYARNAPQGLPNKPFEYFSHGLPVLSSLQGELREILIDHGCGLTYQTGDVESFLSALRQLIEFPGMRYEMGRCAERVFNEQFSATHVYPQMINHLVAIANRE